MTYHRGNQTFGGLVTVVPVPVASLPVSAPDGSIAPVTDDPLSPLYARVGSIWVPASSLVGGSLVSTDNIVVGVNPNTGTDRIEHIIEGDHSADPFETIAGAIAATPRIMAEGHNLLIKLSNDEHVGTDIWSRMFGRQSSGLSFAPFNSTYVPYVPSSGPGSGNFDGSPSFMVYQCTGAGWVPGELVGKHLNSAAGVGPIVANTTDTITCLHPPQPSPGFPALFNILERELPIISSTISVDRCVGDVNFTNCRLLGSLNLQGTLTKVSMNGCELFGTGRIQAKLASLTDFYTKGVVELLGCTDGCTLDVRAHGGRIDLGGVDVFSSSLRYVGYQSALRLLGVSNINCDFFRALEAISPAAFQIDRSKVTLNDLDGYPDTYRIEGAQEHGIVLGDNGTLDVQTTSDVTGSTNTSYGVAFTGAHSCVRLDPGASVDLTGGSGDILFRDAALTALWLDLLTSGNAEVDTIAGNRAFRSDM